MSLNWRLTVGNDLGIITTNIFWPVGVSTVGPCIFHPKSKIFCTKQNSHYARFYTIVNSDPKKIPHYAIFFIIFSLIFLTRLIRILKKTALCKICTIQVRTKQGPTVQINHYFCKMYKMLSSFCDDVIWKVLHELSNIQLSRHADLQMTIFA